MHEKIKKSGLSTCKYKTLKRFLVTVKRYAMVLSFFLKANLVQLIILIIRKV